MNKGRNGVWDDLMEGSQHNSVHIIKPIDNIKKNKSDRKDHSGPLVYGINISQIWDFDFEL